MDFRRAARRTDAAITTEIVSHVLIAMVVGGRVCHAFVLTYLLDITLVNTQDQLLKATEQLNEAKQALAGATNKVCFHLRGGGSYKSSELTESSYITNKHYASNSRSSYANEPRHATFPLFHKCFISSELGL